MQGEFFTNRFEFNKLHFGLFNSDDSFSFAFDKSAGFASVAGVADACVGTLVSDRARSGFARDSSFA